MASKERKFYKVLTKNLRAPSHTEFSYENWQTKTFKVEYPLEMCKSGLHLYTSLENISIGLFGERVFEAEPIGEYISDKNKICCKEIKLIKELKIEEIKDPKWAYYYCRYVKDIPKIYKKITNSRWAYRYCHDIKDRPEVYKNITDFNLAYSYCRHIKDRPEVYKYITDSQLAYKYCRYVKDRPEVYKNITDPEWAYYYCLDIKNRPEVYKHITVFKWSYWHCFLNRLINIIVK